MELQLPLRTAKAQGREGFLVGPEISAASPQGGVRLGPKPKGISSRLRVFAVRSGV
jgi:hypothetical protein